MKLVNEYDVDIVQAAMPVHGTMSLRWGAINTKLIKL